MHGGVWGPSVVTSHHWEFPIPRSNLSDEEPTSVYGLRGYSPCRQGRHGVQGSIGDSRGLRQNLGPWNILILDM